MPTILLIDDNLTILENTAELFELDGYTVVKATNGRDGFQQIFGTLPDIIVCDVLMPQMDGLELLGKLGMHPDLKRIPLIFYSAKSEKSDIKMGMDLGAYDYIVKPTDVNDLLVSIKKCLREKTISK